MRRTVFRGLFALVLGALLVVGCSRENMNVNAPPTKSMSASAPSLLKGSATGDPAVIATLLKVNQQLAAQGLNVAIESADFFTIGNGRPSARLHQLPYRWVPNDPRRSADGDNIRYLVDVSHGTTISGLSSAQTEAAIDAALSTWGSDAALKKVTIEKRPYTGIDPSIVDGLEGFGGIGTPFQADIVDAGWYPRAFFDAIGGPGGGSGILGVTFTFIFVDSNGNPSDINGDNYIDEAFTETYYNNTFGDPSNDRAGFPWAINVPLPAIDVQTVALHENGHALDLGHFGPPPNAVMNPVYAGIRQSPFPSDDAGMNAVWGSWPNP